MKYSIYCFAEAETSLGAVGMAVHEPGNTILVVTERKVVNRAPVICFVLTIDRKELP